MSLQSLLEINQQHDKKQGLSQERINDQLENIRKQIAFYRWYPDLLIDFMK